MIRILLQTFFETNTLGSRVDWKIFKSQVHRIWHNRYVHKSILAVIIIQIVSFMCMFLCSSLFAMYCTQDVAFIVTHACSSTPGPAVAYKSISLLAPTSY